MEVKLSQAVKMFFGNSSLEMVYFEAIANSLDAEATEISIDIFAQSTKDVSTLEIKITDNGLGFMHDRFKKFCKLFDVEESSHKGLGRLVFPCYFESIVFESVFERNQKRVFEFTENLKETNSIISKIEDTQNGTTMFLKNYTFKKLRTTAFVTPKDLKQRVLEVFYPRLFKLKEQNIDFKINISAKIDDLDKTETISNKDIPNLQKILIETPDDLWIQFFLYYSIQKTDIDKTSLIAAISVDERTKKVDIIDSSNVPSGYEMVFLLYSEWFKGKVDFSRQNLEISDEKMKPIHHLFRKKVIELVENEIPTIKERNKRVKNILVNRYPHLSGYFKTENIGYVSNNDVLKKAQEDFFRDQKELLEASSLTDEQFKKSLDISSRALTEYVLFRQLTIQKLKNSTKENSEADLHSIFVPMREQLDKKDFANNIYRNNAWLLDDKFMTFETIFSDMEMGKIIEYITDSEVERNAERPDLALIFSNNPDNKKPFDVVIVEFKKRGEKLYENLKAINQLESRARKLMKYYNNQIQRIWFYAIIELNEEVELALGEYTKLYSAGKMYYKETKVTIQLEPELKLPASIYVWDIDAVIEDANARNSAFLNLIKSKFIDD